MYTRLFGPRAVMGCAQFERVNIMGMKATGVGCHKGNGVLAAHGYAGDIVLLSPTKSAFSQLRQVVNLFSKEFVIYFNAHKCKLVDLGKAVVVHDSISFNDTTIVSKITNVKLNPTIGCNVNDAHQGSS